MTHESAILGLLADLYRDRSAMEAEITRMREEHARVLDALARENHRLRDRLRELDPVGPGDSPPQEVEEQ